MKSVHVECLPDETLVKKLGFTQKSITHHFGKSRVFKKLGEVSDQLAVVDEDPGSAQTSYEKQLKLVEESNGIKLYRDNRGNKVLVLKVKLEDWILSACRLQEIKITKYNLPDKSGELHGIINSRISSLNKLLEELIDKRNPAIMKLKEWLQ